MALQIHLPSFALHTENFIMERNFDIEKVSQAIEADAGQKLPDIRQALADVKVGNFGRVNTPEQILAYREQKLSRDIKP